MLHHKTAFLLTIFTFFLLTLSALAQPFSAASTGVSFPNARIGNAAWFKLNNDKLPDLILIIHTASHEKFFKIYENLGGNQFKESNIEIVSDQVEASGSILSVVDFNSDGYDDLLLGYVVNGQAVTNLYKNISGTGFQSVHNFTGVFTGAVDWADYDRDGNLDVFISGNTYPGIVSTSKLYRGIGNDDFEEVPLGFPNLSEGIVKWADFNKDGFSDLLMTGWVRNFNQISPATHLYRNNGSNSFQDFTNSLNPVGGQSSGDVADYDLDGDIDFILSSSGGNGPVSLELYRNEQGVFNFIKLPIGFQYILNVKWVDFNGDEASDLAISAAVPAFGGGSRGITSIQRNNNDGTFTDINAGLLGSASTFWADVDLDGDPDCLLIGSVENGQDDAQVILYLNNKPIPTPLPTISPTIVPTLAASPKLELLECKSTINKYSKITEKMTCSVKNSGTSANTAFKLLLSARKSRGAVPTTLGNKFFGAIPPGATKKFGVAVNLKKGMKKGKYFLDLQLLSDNTDSTKSSWQSKSAVKVK